MSSSNVTISNSIIYKHSNSVTIENNELTSLGNNIFSDAPSSAISTDQTNIDSATLALEPLAMNGGYTPTMIPGLTSVALNMGNPNDFSDAQNGPIFGRRDVGAAERAVISYDTTLACAPVNWWGNTYNTAGTYTDTAYNANSIDSVGVLVLERQDTGVVNMNGMLTALESDPNTSFQWVDCDNNFASIAGETDSSFMPSANGNYAVILSNGTCSDTSACILYEEFRIQESQSSSDWLTFYPNPASDVIHIRTEGVDPTSLEIMDLSGRSVFSREINGETSITLPSLSSGTYLLRWKGSAGDVQVERVVIR